MCGHSLEGVLDRADREWPGVDERGRSVRLRGEDGGAVAHLPMGQRRPVLDREHPLAGDFAGVAFDVERGSGEDDARVRVVDPDRVEHRVDPLLARAVHLVHDADVRHAQVRLARVIAELVAGPVRVDDDDVQVGLDERRVVVAAVPEDDVGLLLGRVQDRAVVDPGEDEVALAEMRLVLLALLDRAFGRVQILVAREALDGLLGEVAVGHRVAEDGDLVPGIAQDRGDVTGRLALAGAGANGADGDDRLGRAKLRLVRREQAEARACGERTRGDVHDVLVGHVRVREDDLVDSLRDDLLELASPAGSGFPPGRGLRPAPPGTAAPSMFGICVAVNATTSNCSRPR